MLRETIINGKGRFCSSKVDCFLAIIADFPQPGSSIRKIVISPIYLLGNFQECCEFPIATKNRSKKRTIFISVLTITFGVRGR